MFRLRRDGLLMRGRRSGGYGSCPSAPASPAESAAGGVSTVIDTVATFEKAPRLSLTLYVKLSVPWKFAGYKPDCAGCHAGRFKPEAHIKVESPRILYSMTELKNACCLAMRLMSLPSPTTTSEPSGWNGCWSHNPSCRRRP